MDGRLYPAHDDEFQRAVTVGRVRGLDGKRALVSVACDLRIHEVVDAPNWVVGCFIPESIFDQGG